MTNKIDRLYITSNSGKRKLKSMKFRYIAKSIIANCKGDGENFEYVNFRGAHIANSSFKKTVFKGCDFWGTTFRKCKFNDAIFQDCVFQGCKFKDCDFTDTIIKYSVIVNTNIKECKNISLQDTTAILNRYPEASIPEELLAVLENLKDNDKLRKTKLLWLSDKKVNKLNLFLLQKKYSNTKIKDYIERLTSKEIEKLTTYGSLSYGLRKSIIKGII